MSRAESGPALDAELVTHAIDGRVSGHLKAHTRPSPDEAARLLRFCVSTARDNEAASG